MKTYEDYLAIIDKIEAIRGKNNKNWMDLLRLAFRHAPEEAAAIVAGIYTDDQQISELARQLTETDEGESVAQDLIGIDVHGGDFFASGHPDVAAPSRSS